MNRNAEKNQLNKQKWWNIDKRSVLYDTGKESNEFGTKIVTSKKILCQKGSKIKRKGQAIPW